MEFALIIAASAAIGFIVGVLSGLLGIGGGTILVPVFKLAFGLPATVSTATSLFTIIPTSISGASTHIKKKTCIPILGIVAGIGGACTSSFGVWLASISPEWLIMVMTALVVAYSAITMFMKAMKLRKKQKLEAAQPKADDQLEVRQLKAGASNLLVADAAGESVHVDSTASDVETAKVAVVECAEIEDVAQSESHESGESEIVSAENEEAYDIRKAVPIKRIVSAGLAIGALAGVLSGYIGVGGGFLMVPLFIQFLNIPMKLTSGTSLIAVMILAIPGTITNAMLGNIQWLAGIFVAIGAIPGAMVGSRFISKIPEFQLRMLFSGFLIVAAALLILEQLGII